MNDKYIKYCLYCDKCKQNIDISKGFIRSFDYDDILFYHPKCYIKKARKVIRSKIQFIRDIENGKSIYSELDEPTKKTKIDYTKLNIRSLIKRINIIYKEIKEQS